MPEPACVRVIGIDGGLANFGIAVAEVGANGLVYSRVEVWTTKPSAKKRRIRKADDTASRVRELAGQLHELIGAMRPVALAVEAVALPFGCARLSVISALGRARGIVDTLAEVHGLPVLEETAQHVKRETAGLANATKEAVRESLEATYPELRAMWPAQVGLIEHASDAAAVLHACRKADVVLAALKARSAA